MLFQSYITSLAAAERQFEVVPGVGLWILQVTEQSGDSVVNTSLFPVFKIETILSLGL